MASHNPNAPNNPPSHPNTANAPAYHGQALVYYSPAPASNYYPGPVVASSSNFITQHPAGAGQVPTYAPLPPPNSGYYTPAAPAPLPSSFHTYANPNAPSASYDQSYNNPNPPPAGSYLIPPVAPSASYDPAVTNFAQYASAANLGPANSDFYHPGYNGGNAPANYAAGFVSAVGYPPYYSGYISSVVPTTVNYASPSAATAHAGYAGNAVYVTSVYASGSFIHRSGNPSHHQNTQGLGCPICKEQEPPTMYTVQGCSHRFCNQCMQNYLNFQLSNAAGLPRCPQFLCSTVLQPADCEDILSPELLQMMKDRLEESAIPALDRVYCPNPKCSALMSKSSLSHLPTTPFVKCFKCEQYFCLNCLGSYSSDGNAHSCRTEQEKSLRMTWELRNVAQERGWRQCPKCNHMIELQTGCYHITCRCGHEFCYRCGAPHNPYGFGCLCPVWDERDHLYNPIW